MSAIVWARHKRLRIAHAFTDLSAGEKGLVVPIEHYATYPHPDMIVDDLAERCAACERAVKRLRAAR
jgi:hypothetical protein